MTMIRIHDRKQYDKKKHIPGDCLSTRLTDPLVAVYNGFVDITTWQMEQLIKALKTNSEGEFTKVMNQVITLNTHKIAPNKNVIKYLYKIMYHKYTVELQHNAFTKMEDIKLPNKRERIINTSQPTITQPHHPKQLMTARDLSCVTIDIEDFILINPPLGNNTWGHEYQYGYRLREKFGKLYDHLTKGNENKLRNIDPELHILLSEGNDKYSRISCEANNMPIILALHKDNNKKEFITKMISKLRDLKHRQASLTAYNKSSALPRSKPTEHEIIESKDVNDNTSIMGTTYTESKDTEPNLSKSKQKHHNRKVDSQPPLSKKVFGKRMNPNNPNSEQIKINNSKDNNTYTVNLTGGADMNVVKTLIKDVIKETKNLKSDIPENTYLKPNNNEGFESLEGDFKYEKKGNNTHIFTFPNKDAAANFIAKLRLKEQISMHTHKKLCEKLGVDATENLEKYKSKGITGDQTNIQLSTQNTTQPTPKKESHPQPSRGLSNNGLFQRKSRKTERDMENNKNRIKKRQKEIKNQRTRIKNGAEPNSNDNTHQKQRPTPKRFNN